MKKTVLITGASSGIGKVTARYFAEKGWNVAATMRSPEKENDLSRLENIKLYKLDVTLQEDITTALQDILTDFSKIDVLVNNAGYGAIGVFEKSTDEEIQKQFDVNLFGLMRLTRAIIPVFRKQGHGIIINISSVAGRVTLPIFSVYHASKFAVEGFAESLQYELKSFNIKVKNVEPGAIKTDFYGRSQTFFENDRVKGYDKLETGIMKYMQKSANKAPGPEVVAHTIYKAATDGKNKLRYPAGKQARMTLLSRGLIPSSWFNSVVQKLASRLSK